MGRPATFSNPLRKRLSESSLSSRRVKVVCVTGMPGCGKDELLGVARDLGFSIVRMGDVVREEATRRGLPITDEAVGGMAHAERQAYGFGIWRSAPSLASEASTSSSMAPAVQRSTMASGKR